MKRALSLILALTLVFVCVFAFASCGELKGTYKDTYGSVWKFSGNRLKIETVLTVDKVDHTVVAVFSYDFDEGKTDKDGTKAADTLTTVLKKYKYYGDNATVKEKVKEMNTFVSLQSETANTSEYTVSYDAKEGKFITLKKGTVSTKLTVVQ